MDSKFNVALVGCGSISATHIDSLNEIDLCNIALVCDTDKDAADFAAKKSGADAVYDYNDILDNDSISSVHILTPHYLHTPMAKQALKAGKHVLIEKPVGINIDELKDLKKAETENEPYLSVVLQNRYNNTSQKMKSLIHEGYFGKFIASKGFVAWHRDEKYYSDSLWRGRWKTEGGGLLINQAIHTLDLMRWLGGEVEALKGFTDNTMHPNIEVEDSAMATLYYKNGAVGNFYATNNHGHNSKIELEFVFEEGRLRQLDDKLFITKNGKTELFAEDIIKGGKKAYWGMSHTACIRSFYRAVAEGGTPDISLSDAAVTNEMVFGIYESSKTGNKYYMTEG